MGLFRKTLQKGIYDIFDSWRFYKTLKDKKKLTWRFPERENKCTAEVYSLVYSKLAIYIINSALCRSLEILDALWGDYRTGHLNDMAQKYLVTKEVLKEFDLNELD